MGKERVISLVPRKREPSSLLAEAIATLRELDSSGHLQSFAIVASAADGGFYWRHIEKGESTMTLVGALERLKAKIVHDSLENDEV